METKVYSSFDHSFECGKNASREIHYYEKQWVKGPLNTVICIDSAENEAHGAKLISIIGKVVVPEFKIELWAKKSFLERAKQDFITLQMEKQIIHYCNGSIEIFEIKDYQLTKIQQ